MTGIDPSIFEAKRSSAFLTVKLAEIAKNDTWVMITGRNIEEKRSLRARLWALDGAKIKQAEESTESTSPFHLAIHSGSNANTYTDSPNTFTEAPQIYDPDETEDETNPRIMNNGRSRFRPLAPTPRGQDPRETVSQSQIGIVINGGRRFTSSDVNETGRHRGMENMMTYGQSRSMALAPSSYGRRTDATGNVRNSVATLVGGSHFTPINARGRRTDATGNVRNSDATLVGGSHFTPINARDANVTAVRPTSLLGELDSVDRELLRESNSQTPQAEVPWNGGAGFHEESDASGDESSDFEIDDPPIITVTRPPGPDHAKDLANQVAEFLRRWAQRPASGLSAENEDRYFIKHARRWGMSVRKISESGVLQTGRTDPIGIEYRIRQMLHKGKDVRPRTDGFVWKRHQASLKTPSTPKALEIKKVKQAIFDGWSAQQIVDSGIITEGINIVPAVKHRWSSYLWRGYKFPPPC
ncbi:MAG: hypothetical protein LQ352_006706 [Teloschistes flavicans]|nr:MAG: hypothetical protein LQ352_006706 [Teloschistes flavicans]